ncbi:DDE-type integrase/transposase/recombinase [Paenibacillus sp. S3N08]|uniref:DDE-type integrase/transposase/recombinase n=1 Tax=Paenibacillus agricola TaxID=2716264 RepID=A0ABX0JIS3_9BACL|nr:DDE-type integrase/transposase/recombinase [Paenibacillus agricola]
MGKTIDFMLFENRDMAAAKRFFTKALSSLHNQNPRVITLDKNPAYPPAIQELKSEKSMPKETTIRQTKYLNNIVEQDHRFIKKITKPMLGFKKLQTAEQTLKGNEAMHMIRKGQVETSSVFTAVEWL